MEIGDLDTKFMDMENKKEEKQIEDSGEKVEDKLVKSSFYVTYAFLVTTGTITFIEALRTNISAMRHILNLETCISIVAAYFYGKFMIQIEKKTSVGEPLTHDDYVELNATRYVDWSITTPIMLLVLLLAFQYNLGKKGLSFVSYLFVLLLNFGMLGSGYLGEQEVIARNNANLIGFLFFGAMYGYIYYKFLYKQKNVTNELLYAAFFVLWAFYGVFYQLQERVRNVGYNILDLLSKCFVGIYFWTYSSGIFK